MVTKQAVASVLQSSGLVVDAAFYDAVGRLMAAGTPTDLFSAPAVKSLTIAIGNKLGQTVDLGFAEEVATVVAEVSQRLQELANGQRLDAVGAAAAISRAFSTDVAPAIAAALGSAANLDVTTVTGTELSAKIAAAKVVLAGGSDGADLILGTTAADSLSGLRGNDTIWAGLADDALVGGENSDVLDGGAGIDRAVYRGTKADYTITRNADGSYAIVDRVNGRDGADTVANVELLQFSDQTFLLTTDLPFPALFAANLSQAKAIAAAYEMLLGGVPGQAGYEFLIKGNLSTNFGAGEGPVFNDENIYINVANALVQGNATATAKFNTLAAGNTLAEKVTSLYKAIIPTAKQSADGLAFITRPDGLKFYEDVARERGITAENGPAVTALASLLKIAVDGKSGIGNPVGDLIASIGDGSSELPATSQVVLPIETVDGTKFDADDAPDAALGFSAPTPVPVPVIGVAELQLEPAGF